MLNDEGYHWYHSQVLKALTDGVMEAIQRREYHLDKYIKFLKPGEKHCSKPSTRLNWLSAAKGWQFKVDMGNY